jgi:hypothetical protein
MEGVKLFDESLVGGEFTWVGVRLRLRVRVRWAAS